jgi:DNA repair protein RadC
MKTIRWQLVMEGNGDYVPFRSAEDVVRRMKEAGYADRDRECFVVYLLNAKHNVIAEEVVSIGILDGSLLHPREVFKAAVAAGAASILVAHNHPSGIADPSEEDKEVSRRLREAGALLGIPLLDHVIVVPGSRCFYSFRESGTGGFND